MTDVSLSHAGAEGLPPHARSAPAMTRRCCCTNSATTVRTIALKEPSFWSRRVFNTNASAHRHCRREKTAANLTLKDRYPSVVTLALDDGRISANCTRSLHAAPDGALHAPVVDACLEPIACKIQVAKAGCIARYAVLGTTYGREHV